VVGLRMPLVCALCADWIRSSTCARLWLGSLYHDQRYSGCQFGPSDRSFYSFSFRLYYFLTLHHFGFHGSYHGLFGLMVITFFIDCTLSGSTSGSVRASPANSRGSDGSISGSVMWEVNCAFLGCLDRTEGGSPLVVRAGTVGRANPFCSPATTLVFFWLGRWNWASISSPAVYWG